jgi:hypothetical protein
LPQNGIFVRQGASLFPGMVLSVEEYLNGNSLGLKHIDKYDII